MSAVPNPSLPADTANPVVSVPATTDVPTTVAPPATTEAATTAPPTTEATTAPTTEPTTAPTTEPTTAPTTAPTTTPPAAETPVTTPPVDATTQPTTAPTVPTTAPVGQDTIVITTSADGSTIFLTSTSIATPTTDVAAAPGTATPVASSSTSTGADASSAPSTGGGGSSGGLTGTTKIVVAVVVPIIGVALIAIVLLFLWKKRRRDKENSEMRRKEVEDYGYNPNSAPAAAVGGTSSNGDELPYEMAENTVGYRGWGSTRKASNMGSSMPSSVGTAQPMSPAFPEGVHHQDNYNGFPTSPTASNYPVGTAPSDGGMSNAPLITTPPGYRPESTDSSVVAAMTGPQTANNPGIRRGISNASSNYSVQSVSDQSDVGMPPGPYDSHYYGADGAYEDPHNYSARFDNGQDYTQYPPVIREVQARRNTQIETPTNTHFPQQGNSGIAQNF
ncbi:hypothetical protein BZA05DRAFT_424048 [Tricharina praecox]|uniref:uncharacterized protein n=1 Tax=Tricharina praecox TaxID=43433 RepID=UPI002220A49A|nr:uncharacterized protein BZA05DRAFT_424048 [Tricharina praecox]KAI5857102.1 hypothetical protein BZA05DRAFT_424048 [Tricharina praecox]